MRIVAHSCEKFRVFHSKLRLMENLKITSWFVHSASVGTTLEGARELKIRRQWVSAQGGVIKRNLPSCRMDNALLEALPYVDD